MAIIASFFAYLFIDYFDEVISNLTVFGVSFTFTAFPIYVIIKLWINKSESLVIVEKGIILQRANHSRDIKAQDIKKIVYYESEAKNKWLFVCLKSSLVIPISVTNFSHKTEEMVGALKSMLQQKHSIEVCCTSQKKQIEALFAASCVKPEGPVYEVKNCVVDDIIKLIIIIPFIVGFSEVFYDKIGNRTYSMLITIFLGLLSTGILIATIVTKIKEGEIHLTMNGNGYLTHDLNIKWEDVDSLELVTGGKYTDLFLQKKDGEYVHVNDVSSTDLEEQVSYFAQRFIPLVSK